MISFVLLSWRVNPGLIDAVIALSVVYKALENLNALPARTRPDPRAAVFVFGLVHGMGLASKLQSLRLARDGLVTNLLAFNGGVELGQLCALAVLVAGLALWARRPSFVASAARVNRGLAACGLVLLGVQLSNYEHGDLSAAAQPSQLFTHAARNDLVEIPLGLGAELEYKLAMEAGDVLVYSWQVVGAGKVYFEFHGEASGGDAPHVESYEIGDGVHESYGVLRATFGGVHGWYLLNDSDTPIVVRLHASGFYQLAPQFASVGRVLPQQDVGAPRL